MPVHRHKKDTTPTSPGSTQEQTIPPLPDQQTLAWRQRPLQEYWRILYLDGIHFSIRHGDKADSTIILTALGVDLTL